MQSSTEKAPLPSFSIQDIGRHYDQFAWAYRRYWGDHIHHGLFLDGVDDSLQAQELMLRHCAERAGVRPGMAVADVGCGHGGTALFLAKEYFCNVLGLTVSKAQWKLASESAGAVDGRVRFELADAESYAFPESSFDLIWNMESSEHFFDKAAYFRKAAAALKPGGKLMVATWTGSMQQQLIRDIARIFLCPQLWPAEEHVRQIELAGMKVISCEQLAAEVVRTWDLAAESVRQSGVLLSILPAEFREFAQGIELMREGYGNGELTYSIIVAGKERSGDRA
jgi:tocopherol O-methyltransferase